MQAKAKDGWAVQAVAKDGWTVLAKAKDGVIQTRPSQYIMVHSH